MPRDSGPARQSLIAAGERLFAERGVHGVSMREINLAAGQRHASALHYHFGSKDGLLMAILAPHLQRIREHRIELLAHLAASDGQNDAWSVARALVEPLTLPLQYGPSGRACAQIIAQTMTDPSRTAEQIGELLGGMALDEARAVLMPFCATVPEIIAEERLWIQMQDVVHVVSDRALNEDRGRPWRLLPYELFVSNLIDMFVSALLAPVSPSTVSALRSVPKRARGERPPRAHSSRRS